MKNSGVENSGPIRFGSEVIPHFQMPMHGVAEAVMGGLLGFSQLNALHAQAIAVGGACWSQCVLDSLDVRCEVMDSQLTRIPSRGPLVVVANHPFGGLDGLALAAMLRRVRPDVKLIANFLLRAIPELQDEAFFVDPFGGADAAARSVAGLRAALRWVKAGGALAVFPAGEVSRIEWTSRRVVDRAWNPTIAKLIRRTGAHVTPVYFEGRNRAIFHLAGLAHERIRTAMLGRELLAKRGAKLKVRIGTPIAPTRMKSMDDHALTTFLRAKTYVLQHLSEDQNNRSPRGIRSKYEEPIAAPRLDRLAREIAALPSERCLASSGQMKVYYADAAEIPGVLYEIGRQREIAFRQVGEGTGTSLDLDEFDRRYLHLFIWHSADEQVIGAYRIGLTDQIVNERGSEGLYTHTLFRYSKALLSEVGPALELGRSFVRPEYQRDFAPLTLLWSGIARFVADHPQYKMLFGPVSISSDYSSMSKHLLMTFMRVNNYWPRLGKLIEARNPPRMKDVRGCDASLVTHTAQSLDDVDDLLRELESGGRGMPVLVRQYLKLKARVLGFNVDREFGNALDALVLVDLSQADRRFLLRYMGRDRAESFLHFHGLSLQTERIEQAMPITA